MHAAQVKKICQTKHLNFFSCSDHKNIYHFGQKISNLNRTPYLVVTNLGLATVVFSFVFDNYYLIMD